jgi:outer membrane protein insertion porin family
MPANEESGLLTRIRAALIAAACLLSAVLLAGPVAAQLPPPSAASRAAGPAGQPPSGQIPAGQLPAGRAPAAQLPPGRATPAAAGPANRGPVPAGGIIQSIQVQGNQRIESGTILSYMLVQPGDAFDAGRIDRSLKTLYATGLFQDVNLTRQGDTLIVKVVENPLVNRVAFEGNSLESDDQLRAIVQLRPRAVFTPAQAEADRQHILDAYAKRGRFDATVDPQIIRLSENRVDVVYEISDGPTAFTSRITIVGNKAFSEGKLKDVIDSRQHYWWMFLSTSDEYNPERLNFDKELLRRFYLKNGYIDFNVVDATAELSPDRTSFFLTFTIHEGERYKVNKIAINSHLRNIDGDQLKGDLQLSEGDWYDGDAVGRTIDMMEDDVRSRGYAFVDVKPQIDRDAEKHTVSLTFDVGEGPRVYVERIDITGNTRTKDKVIRREFRLAEGDAFNAEAVRRSRQRLQDLGYFSNVTIDTLPGSTPDKAILSTNVSEKATGELTLGGGFSTDAGALVDAGLAEHNLIGTGIDASLNGVLAQKRSSVTLSVTDPYFLDRNLLAGADVFLVQTYNLGTEPYDEKRVGFSLRMGYAFNEHVRQTWSYSLVGRTVYDIQPGASFFILDEAGYTLLSQVSQVFTVDYRDSKVEPRSGWVASLGTDVAGLGGNAQFVRPHIDAAYYIPLDRQIGENWGLAFSAGAGYFFNLGVQEQVIDRFYLGGDNLRGFQIGGAGPHAIPTATTGADSLGGRFIWTQSSELRFPLPVSPDLGLSGRLFVDVGGLTEGNFEKNSCPTNTTSTPPGQCPAIFDSSAPRVGAGFGISWHSSFGLINIDLAPFVIKQKYDQTQIFRFGFGTRF